MALLKCKNCGHLISPKAETCPNCHHSYTIKGLNGTWNKIFLLSCILVILGGIVNNWSPLRLERLVSDYDLLIYIKANLEYLISKLVHNIGMFLVIYVIARTFKTRSMQRCVVALWAVSLFINEVWTFEPYFRAYIYASWRGLLVCLYITSKIMCVIAFLLMTRQVQKQMKGCIYILLLAYLMAFCAIIENTYDMIDFDIYGDITQLVNCIICIIAIIYLLYISYKK